MKTLVQHSKSDIIGVFEGLNVAVLLLDKDLNIMQYTSLIRNYMNISADDIGQPFMNVIYITKYAEIGTETRSVMNSKIPFQTKIELPTEKNVFVSIMPLTGPSNARDEILVSFSDEKNTNIPMGSPTSIETRYNNVLSTLNDGVIIFAPDSTVISINNQAAKIFGVTEQNMVGKLMADSEWNMFFKDGRPIPLEESPYAIALMTKEPIVNQVIGVQAPDSSEIKWVEVNVSPVVDEQGTVIEIIAGFNNISEIVKLQDHYQATEERYRSFFHTSRIPMLVIETASGSIVDANDAACKFYGWTMQKMTNKNISEINTLPRAEILKQLARAGNSQQNHFYFQHKVASGEIRDVEVFTGPYEINGSVFIQTIIHDISEQTNIRKAFEETTIKLMNANRNVSKVQKRGKIGSWIFQPDTGYCHGSEEAIRLFGLGSNDNLTYEKIQSCIQEKEKIHQDLMNLIEHGVTLNDEYNVYPADGSAPRIIRAIADLDKEFENANITVVGTILDVTDVKASEAMLDQSRRNFETLFNTIGEMLFILDEQGIIKHVNDSVCKRLGYTIEEITGQSVFKIHSPEDREDVAQVFAEILSGIRMNCPFNLITKTGEPIVVESRAYKGTWDGNPAIYGITKDISEITLSEEKFSKVFHLNPSACGFTDLATEKYLEVNKAFYDLLGYEEHEIIGKTPLEAGIMTMDDLIAVTAQIPPGASKIPKLEATLTAKNGDKKMVTLGGEDFNINGKRFRYTVVNDLTDYKNAINSLHELNDTLEQHVQSRTNQLESAVKELEAFSYSLSHDLRAPLRAINGFSAALIEDYDAQLDETARNYLNRMASSAQRMSLLIDDLLNLSVITRKEIEIGRIDIKRLASDIIETTNSENNFGVEIEDGLIISGDHGLVRIAFENLIGNAIKYSAQVSSPMIKIGRIIKNGKEYIYIKDNGVGFNMEYASKLFIPFQRLHADTDFTGTGIGLAIVWRIVNKHGGDIWGESVVGEGATFYIRLER
ncbi:MAG: PAS domain S-box protein [Bacteroidota bacterium]